MGNGLIVDTSFLISLADKSRVNHAAALSYWEYFRKQEDPIYLSTIVVSEFEVKQQLDPKVISACVPIVFDWMDALRTAKFEIHREQEKGVKRQVVKDDIKIIAQAVGRNVAFAITDDHNTFTKYSEKLRKAGEVGFQTIVLRDGFDIGHFTKGGPDLLTAQGI